MTGFKDYILDEETMNAAANTVKQKRENKKAEYVYSVEMDSGVDTIIRKKMSTGDQLLVLMVSSGQAYVKKVKNGEITPLTQTVYTNFWKGLTDKDDAFTNDTAQVWTKFQKAAEWTNCVISAVKSEKFRQLAKAGLLNIEVWEDICNNNRWNRDIWWGGAYSDEPFHQDVIKLLKHIMEQGMAHGMSKRRILAEMYNVNHYETDVKYTPSAVGAFMIVAAVYGLDIAKIAVDRYAENDLLRGLTAEGVASVLFNNTAETTAYHRYDNPLLPIGQGKEFRSFAGSPDIRVFNPLIHYKTKKVRQEDGTMTEEEYPIEDNGFLDFLFDEAVECGYADTIGNWGTMWGETLLMEFHVFGKIVDKYPNFHTYHDLMAYKERIVKKSYDKAAWNAAKDRFSVFAQSNEEWSLIAPKEYVEIIDEATQQSNCVASYVSRVIKGETNILFLRKTKNPDTSVCTVEISNDGAVIQFKAKRNKTPDNKQREALIKLMTANRKKRKLSTEDIREYIRV